MLSLSEISDRLEIQDLLVRYADAIDRRDLDRLDQVFTPDAAIDYTAFGGIAGSYPEVKAWLGPVLARFLGYQHLVANADIRLDGDRATGRIMCFNPMPMLGASDTVHVTYNGLWYVDVYRRTPDGWRIASRAEERSFAHNIPVLP
jgi:ketosteroid isomerase-like protein